MRNITLFALAAIASAATVTPAVAQAFEPVTFTTIVRTADLDLASPVGQRELDKRIALAAREVCGSASNVDLEGKNAVRECRDKVIVEAGLKRNRILAAKSAEAIQIAAR